MSHRGAASFRSPATRAAKRSFCVSTFRVWRHSQPRALTPNLWLPDALRLAGLQWRSLSASAAVGQADALFPQDVGFHGLVQPLRNNFDMCGLPHGETSRWCAGALAICCSGISGNLVPAAANHQDSLTTSALSCENVRTAS